MTAILIVREPVYVGGEWRHIIPIRQFSTRDSGLIRFKTKYNNTLGHVPTSNISAVVEEKYIERLPDIEIDADIPDDSDIANRN